MKNYLLILTAIFAVTFVSCRSKKETVKTVTEVPPPPPPPLPPPDETSNGDGNVPITYRIVVSFVSFGAGIDLETHDKFKAYLDSDPKKPAYEAVAWGREGEVDYCLLLKEYNPNEQKGVILELKKIVEKSDRVRVEEYKPCAHKK